MTAALLLSIVSHPALAQSLCMGDEQTLFSCRIANSGKQLALCASPQLDANGWLVYRFGAPGKVELSFPERREASLQRFGFWHYMRYQTDYTEVSFSIGTTQYKVYDHYQGEEKPAYARGVLVTMAPGREIDLPCSGKVKSELHKLEGLLPCADKDDCTGR